MKYSEHTTKLLNEAKEKPQNVILAGNFNAAMRDEAIQLASGWLDTADPYDHPDFYAVEPDKNTVTKEAIDAAIEFTHSYPSRASFRVVVIFDADKMNAASQSALLKVLEDGAKTAKFILCTHEPMYGTITSRCSTITMTPPSFEDFLEGNADELKYHAAAGCYDAYEIMSESFTSFLHALPDAVFNTQKLFELCGAVKEKDACIWESGEEEKKWIINIFDRMAESAALYAFVGKDSNVFRSFECFRGARESQVARLGLAIENYDRLYRNGNASKNSFMLFLLDFSRGCASVKGGNEK